MGGFGVLRRSGWMGDLGYYKVGLGGGFGVLRRWGWIWDIAIAFHSIPILNQSLLLATLPPPRFTAVPKLPIFPSHRFTAACRPQTLHLSLPPIIAQDIDKAMYVAQRIDAGTCFVNTYNKTDVAAPFGGFKQSGFGKDLGEDALNEYLKTKCVTVEYNSSF